MNNDLIGCSVSFLLFLLCPSADGSKSKYTFVGGCRLFDFKIIIICTNSHSPHAIISTLQQRVTNVLSSLPSVSYYLARFKDAYRQATIDMMLGNHVSPESVSALGGQSMVPDETDALESAEHARLLVEDCRRMLLGSAQHPIGAWGLIDADPT